MQEAHTNQDLDDIAGGTATSPDEPPPPMLQRAAGGAALGALAVKAKELASAEEQELRRLVALAIEKQLRKIELKLSAVDKLTALVQAERENVRSIRGNGGSQCYRKAERMQAKHVTERNAVIALATQAGIDLRAPAQ